MMRRALFGLLLGCGVSCAHALGVVQDAAADVVVGVAKGAVEVVSGGADKSRPKARPATATMRAPVRPQPVPWDPRLVRFPYSPDFIYPILTKLDTYTHIELAENEKIVLFSMPDKLRWNYKVSLVTKRDIYVKAVVPNVETPATLVTNQRRYELTFSVGGEDDGGTWYQRVSWLTEDGGFESIETAGAPQRLALTPQPVLAAVQNPGIEYSGGQISGANPCGQERIQVDKLNFNYTIVGDAPFKPTMVFDDGRFTWFKFPKLQDVPPIFALAASGEAKIETFWRCKEHLLVQALIPAGAVLKLGKDEVRIVNQNTQKCGGFFESDCKPVTGIRDR